MYSSIELQTPVGENSTDDRPMQKKEKKRVFVAYLTNNIKIGIMGDRGDRYYCWIDI